MNVSTLVIVCVRFHSCDSKIKFTYSKKIMKRNRIIRLPSPFINISTLFFGYIHDEQHGGEVHAAMHTTTTNERKGGLLKPTQNVCNAIEMWRLRNLSSLHMAHTFLTRKARAVARFLCLLSPKFDFCASCTQT